MGLFVRSLLTWGGSKGPCLGEVPCHQQKKSGPSVFNLSIAVLFTSNLSLCCTYEKEDGERGWREREQKDGVHMEE